MSKSPYNPNTTITICEGMWSDAKTFRKDQIICMITADKRGMTLSLHNRKVQLIIPLEPVADRLREVLNGRDR